MVYSEWPLGINLTEAEDLAALARSRHVRTAIGLQARSSPLLRYLRDLVANGYLGTMLSTTLVSSHNAWADALKTGPYILDKANGANLLTVGFGHTVDAVTMVLGEFTEVTATSRNLLPTYRDTTTAQVITKNTDDHIAVTGVLESGAVANVLVRGGVSRATDFRWEMNGTDGDLVVTSHGSSWNRGLTLVGRQGSQNEFVALPVPASYEQRVPQFAGRSNETAYNIAYAYAQLRDDITEGTNVVPDFDHAVCRHRLIDAVERAAETGQRQTVALKD
jgi:predicted dehydrogenase